MDKKTKKVLATLAITTMAVMPTTIAIVRTVEHQPPVANAFSQINISSYSQEKSYENVSLYDDILFDNSDVKVVNEVKSSTDRGSAADRFIGSATDKVGAPSESDLSQEGFVPPQDTNDLLDELDKGNAPTIVDPTINPPTGETADGINNVSQSNLTGQSVDVNEAIAYTISAIAGVLSLAVIIVGAIHIRRRTDGERVRTKGTRVIQDSFFIGDSKKLSKTDKKIAKKEANGKTVSDSLKEKREELALKVSEKSFKTVGSFNPKLLEKYAYYAKWRKYPGYFDVSLIKKYGYMELLTGLFNYANYLQGDRTRKSNQRYLKNAITAFNNAASEIQNDVYFGSWTISNDAPGLNGDVKLSKIPVFPFRYVQNQGLEITTDQKVELENFFDDVFAENAHNEQTVTYGTISYYREGTEIPSQMKYAFDSRTGSKLLKSKLLTLIPEDATKVIIEETNKRSKAETTTETLKTRLSIAKAKENALETISNFNKTYEVTSNNSTSKDDGMGM